MVARTAVVAIACKNDFALKALTFSRILFASAGSSMRWRPVPSTSQTPPCAIFHKPSWAESKKPKLRNTGNISPANLPARGTPARGRNTLSANATVVPTYPTLRLLARSSSSILVRSSAALARRLAANDGSTGSSLGSISSLKTHLDHYFHFHHDNHNSSKEYFHVYFYCCSMTKMIINLIRYYFVYC